MNGIVHIMGANSPDPFALYDKIPVRNNTSYNDAMQGNWSQTALSKAFFDKKNIQTLQNGLREGVYKLSKGRYVIGQQNEDTLKIIMRSTFLQSSLNQPTNISGQLQALNQLVLNYAVPQVCGEAESYIKYKSDVSNLAVPMATPTYVSTAGQNTLELKPWF